MPPAARKSSTEAEIIAGAVATAIAAALQPSLAALADDKENRHRVAGVADAAMNLATTNQRDLEHVQKVLNAVVGDGTGENGKLALMGNTMRKTQDDVSELKGDMKTVLSTMTELKTTSEQSKSWMSGARGFYVFLGIMALLITVISGIAGCLFWLYKH